MTRIAFYLPRLDASEAEKSLRLALEVQRRGHDVVVFTESELGALSSAFTNTFDIRILSPASPAIARPAVLARALQPESFDVLLAASTRGILSAALMKRLGVLKPALIGWEHQLLSSLNQSGLRAAIERRLIRALYPICDHIVFPSSGAAEDARSFCAPAMIHATEIYDSVTAPLWQPLSPEEHAIAERLQAPRIVAHGPLIASRDYGTLLRAFQQLSRVKGGSLLIIGEGPLRTTLESTATGLGLGDRVVFAPNTDPVANLLALGDLYVSSATSDSAGSGLMEAMASGIPIVAADCPTAPRDILAGGRYGKLVPPGDPRALWHAMRDALQAPHDRQALRARAAEFPIERSVEAFLSLIGATASSEKDADKKAA